MYQKNIVISDLRSERLYREAEDELFYFDNIESAEEKIELALSYFPYFIKARVMNANIKILKGEYEKAIDIYLAAEKIAPANVNVLAGLANLYEITDNLLLANKYVNKSLSCGFINAELRKNLIELKISILIRMKKYKEAKSLIDSAKYELNSEELKELQAKNLSVIKNKLQLHKKLNKLNLKLVK